MNKKCLNFKKCLSWFLLKTSFIFLPSCLIIACTNSISESNKKDFVKDLLKSSIEFIHLNRGKGNDVNITKKFKDLYDCIQESFSLLINDDSNLDLDLIKEEKLNRKNFLKYGIFYNQKENLKKGEITNEDISTFSNVVKYELTYHESQEIIASLALKNETLKRIVILSSLWIVNDNLETKEDPTSKIRKAFLSEELYIRICQFFGVDYSKLNVKCKLPFSDWSNKKWRGTETSQALIYLIDPIALNWK